MTNIFEMFDKQFIKISTNKTEFYSIPSIDERTMEKPMNF